jgi:tRNA(Ile)-lysidine synthase
LLQQFKKFIDALGLSHAKLGVAVSGGIDSVVLCELSAQAGLSFFLVHCNFQLRGEESERDEQFVRSLAGKYGVEILVKKFNTEEFAAEHKYSIQVAARELRYRWFWQLHKEDEQINMLLAHHANDDIETLLMNFFRGTGLEGLTGMPFRFHDLFCLRPLLNNTRKEIEDFAKKNNLEWVEDSSNQSNKYTRNFFRNELLPMLKKVYPTVEENLLDNIRRFKQINELYKDCVYELKEKLLEQHFPDVIIPVHKLKTCQNTALIYEIIKDYGFGEKQVDEILKLADSESGKYIESVSHQVIKHRKNLIITPNFVLSQNAIAVEKDVDHVRLAYNNLHLQFYPIEKFKLDKSEDTAQLDATLINFPLIVRKWQQGDYFYPLGLRKKKKLARFFIDNKLSLTDKGKLWVVESDKRIIWVIGLRIDDRFKITSSTKEVLELSISSH